MGKWYVGEGKKYSSYKKKRYGYCQKLGCGKQVLENELTNTPIRLRSEDGKLNKLWLKVCKNCLNLKEDKWKKVV